MTKQQRKWLKRRQAIEPLIGHTKADHGMQRCWLKGALGDALHALSCAAGYNIRWLMRAIAAQAAKDTKAPFFALFGLGLWGRIEAISLANALTLDTRLPSVHWLRWRDPRITRLAWPGSLSLA